MIALLLLACARQPAASEPLGAGVATGQESAAADATGTGTEGAGAPTIPARWTRVGGQGEYPFLTPIDAPRTIALVAGGAVPSTAAACGSCHTEHYKEWRGSTHAAAIHDLQFVAELAKPDQPRWLCLNCHAPTSPQRPELITMATPLLPDLSVDAPPNPDFEPARVGEGVTCATCHVRRDEDGAGIVIGPRGSGRAPHRVRADKAALTDVCVRCHSPGPVTLTPTFTCWFETSEELATGPVAGSACTDCHMPEAERAAAMGGPKITVRRHLWEGGGVPKSYARYDGLLDRGWRAGLDVAVATDPVRVTLTNTRAGHALPTADPERHLRVEARLEAADGTVRARDVLRVGQVWDWGDAASGRPARRLTDNRLAPAEARVWAPVLVADNVAPAPVRLVVEVFHVRLTPANAGSMAATRLDAELRELWAAAPTLLPTLDKHYPLATLVHRETVPLDGGKRVVATPEELVAASRALAEVPLAEKGAILAVP